MIKFWHLLLLSIVLWGLLAPSPAAAAQPAQTATPPDADIARLVAGLSPQQKVGQLFLVTFKGNAIDENAPIFELITRNHVGGVVLLSGNDNFADQDFAAGAQHLATNLQAVAAGLAPTNSGTPAQSTGGSQFIPLFVATSASQPAIASHLQLPTAMTLGATWSLERATAIGRLEGRDLAALGINLLFGPTLDVVQSPQPMGPADQGAQTFGGNPYWVGKMGQAFIQGIHLGSQNQVAVIAQHFPGYGDGDRTLGDQIPAVNKPQAELLKVDLAPFFKVAQGQPGDADGLLVSHIRYSALQGPLSDTVKPISLDQHALSDLLSLPQLAAWRGRGGVTVADALGARALRRFQDPAERNFSAFAVARDAFLAGNDLLYVAGFESTGDDPAGTLKAVLAQFVQKYQEDASFAGRVNEAVTRILTLKKRLYDEFSFERVIAATSGLDAVGANADEVLATTQAAAALLSPTALSSRPNRNGRVLFITDTRLNQTCSTCPLQPTLGVSALQDEVLRLYGPRGTGETVRQNLTSLSFVDVGNFLDNRVAPTETPAPQGTGTPQPTAQPAPGVEESLRSADWVVFGMLDVTSAYSDSLALRRLLAQRPDLLRGKQIVVFAFDAPYYLDATEVAQLTAYYALYNHTPAAVQVAAQILFQEISPASASPVSIPGTGYDLNDTLQPDPDQDIKLVEVRPATDATPAPTDLTPTPSAVGRAITLQTSSILDLRGHPVPDGTPVKFLVTYVSQGIASPVQFAEVPTVDGVATASYLVDKAGRVELSAASGLAQRSDRVIIEAGGPDTVGNVTIVAPPTRTPTATASPSAAPPSTPTPGVTATPARTETPPQPVTGLDLFMTIVTLAVMGVLAVRVTRSRNEAVSDGVKLFLVIAIGALVAYNYFALKLPGYDNLKSLGFWAVPITVWSGGLLGFGFGWWWLRRGSRP